MTHVVVVGLGNPYRRDDGLGPAVVERLRPRHLPGVVLAESDGDPAALLDLWTLAEAAFVVDAVRTGSARPGTIHRRRLDEAPRGLRGCGGWATSSHGVDFGDTVALAAALNRLPAKLVLYAVEVADTSHGRGLSPPVRAAVHATVERLAEELAAVAHLRRGGQRRAATDGGGGWR